MSKKKLEIIYFKTSSFFRNLRCFFDFYIHFRNTNSATFKIVVAFHIILLNLGFVCIYLIRKARVCFINFEYSFTHIFIDSICICIFYYKRRWYGRIWIFMDVTKTLNIHINLSLRSKFFRHIQDVFFSGNVS